MTVPAAPEWLTRHEGALSPGLTDRTVFVEIGGAPLYRLDVQPASGQFVCGVTQTVNGRQIGTATKYVSSEATLAGGLEALRQELGW